MRALVVIVALAMPARADVVLAPGEVVGQLVLEVSLEADHATRPTSLAPDVWWGVAPRWTIGVIHSDPSVDRIAAGASVCIRQWEFECDRVYHGSGIDVRYAALPWLAPRARFLVRELTPWKPALTLGALAEWRHGRFRLTGDPYLQLGLANRDQGNRSQIWLPVEAAVALCRWTLAFDTGWNTQLITWRDDWKVPVAVGTAVRVTDHIEVGATFGFLSLLGPQNNARARVLFFTMRLAGGGAPVL